MTVPNQHRSFKLAKNTNRSAIVFRSHARSTYLLDSPKNRYRGRAMNGASPLVCCLICMSLLSGCSLFHQSEHSLSTVSSELDKMFSGGEPVKANISDSAAEVANPPATTIRFDGHEVVLGTADVTRIDQSEFYEKLSVMLAEQKNFTARNFVWQHSDAAEQLLWSRWASESHTELVRFTASILSRDLPSTISWNGLLEFAKSNPTAAAKYDRSRRAFLQALKSQTEGKEDAQLQAATQTFQHALPMVDSMKLLAIRELMDDRSAWAESLLLQAIEVCETNGDFERAANLWLMIAADSSRTGDLSKAATAWKTAVSREADSKTDTMRPLKLDFWLNAEQQRPGNTDWPENTRGALKNYASQVGCALNGNTPCEVFVNCATANALYETGEPQLALVRYKKAETLLSGDDRLWLRIAQSQCLAALGQSHAAAALLSGPAASSKPAIVAASTAAMGSAKLQSGTYQQGTHLLNKALSESPGLTWPSRTQAEADLALAKLIIGETDQGLRALHAVQKKFLSERKLPALLQAMENELRILELEGRTQEASDLAKRVRRIEQS